MVRQGQKVTQTTDNTEYYLSQGEKGIIAK